MPYSARDYWADLHRRDNLSAVGQSALPTDLNRWLYRILARNVRGFVRRNRLVAPAPARMFEVGSGTGEWIPFWNRLGVARVDGCDLVPAAVDRLNSRFGHVGSFVVAELGGELEAAALTGLRYPLVTVFNVLLHVTDDHRFARALGQVADLVEPGGALLLIEPMLRDPAYARPFDPAATSRARPVDDYSAPLIRAGLEPVEVAAAMALANNPIEAGSPQSFKRYQRAWRLIATKARREPRAVRWIGPLLYVTDRIALMSGAAPSSKIMLLRRPR